MASEQVLATIKDLLANLFRFTNFEVAFGSLLVFTLVFVVYSAWFVYRRHQKVTLALRNPFGNHPKHATTARARLLKRIIISIRKFFRRIKRWIRKALKPTYAQYLFVLTVYILFLAAVITHYFLVRPYVVATYPSGMPWLNLNRPLRIVFDKPVNIHALRFNIAPELTGRIVPKMGPLSAIGLSFFREIEFYPDTNIAPDQEIIVYLVDIQNLTAVDGVHEQNLTFDSGDLSTIMAASVADKAVEIPTSTSVVVTYTDPFSAAIKWDYQIVPPTPVEVSELNAYTHAIRFPEGLKQTTEYKLTAIRQVVVKNLKTNETIEGRTAEAAKTISFTTLKAPLTKNITPQGQTAIPTDPLKIIFDIPMNSASVEENFTIEPETEGTFSWANEDKELTFTPTQPWAKDTSYKITISRTAQAKSDASLDVDLVHEFKTVGAVKLTAIVPGNGATNVSTAVSVSFGWDQAVDQASAQQLFTITPKVAGTFSWDGNTMRFTPSQRLANSTSYKAKVAKGIKAIHGTESTMDYEFEFRTTVGQVLLAVPQYFQAESHTCNIAAMRMALGYRGVYLSEAQIKSGVGIGAPLSGSTGGNPYVDWIDNYGTYWSNSSSYISGYRQNAVRQNWNVTDMLREVQRGNPVIVWWQNGWSSWYWKSWTTPDGQSISGLNGMHSEVVVGFRGDAENPTAIYTNDPWRGRRTYTRAAFDQLWKNSFNRTAIVVY